jgi:adenine-specific DNA-methyltransferase
MWWFLSNTGNVLRGGYFRFKTHYLNPFPVRPIDFNDSDDKLRHDQIVELAKEQLRLHGKLAKIKSSKSSQTSVREQIVTADRQIDQLVYSLYGLTYQEIEVIEAASRQLPSA